MKRSVTRILVAALLLAAGAAWADDSGLLKLDVVYKGFGQYSFEKQDYGSYGDLLTAIRAKYGNQHINVIHVDVTAGHTVAEMLEICRLKRDTGAMVKAHYLVDKQKNDLFCA